MDKILALEIDALITKRILAYHSQLISTGQIQSVDLEGPRANPPLSHCNRSERMQKDDPSEGLAPHQGEPLQSNSGGHGHE